MTEDIVKSFFLLSDFPPEKSGFYKTFNQYYKDDSFINPWWIVTTLYGPIIIGWRKRVISISWKDTPFRGIITPDEVTKDDTSVHAWSHAKTVEYLSELYRQLLKLAHQKETPRE